MPKSSTETRPTHRWLLLVVSAAIVLVADQLSKWWAVSELAPDPTKKVEIIGSLQFRYAENTGMAFSQGAGSGRWIGLIVIVIVIALVVFASKVRSKVQVVLLGVVIGGALGNLIDRAFRAEEGWLSGAVVDFIDLQWWPVFNIADMAVVLGGILLVIWSTRDPQEDELDEPDGSDADDARAAAGSAGDEAAADTPG
ncbi:MAG: signal peptidase II [Actinomycetia bacterium]|nr:signal peptidase II [Actinomycetes bacterium]